VAGVWESAGVRGSSVAFKPEWVILGAGDVIIGDGPETHVAIYASTDLGYAELQAEIDDDPICFGPGQRSSLRHVTMSVTMRSYVVVYGATYEEALRILFERWKPERTERPAIGQQPGLPTPSPA